MTLPWDEAVTVLSGAREVVLACHVGPDGDALGSLLALGQALRARGARVWASWGEAPLQVPRTYGYLPFQDLLTAPGDVPAAPEVLVTLDSSSPDRLGLLADRIDAAGTVLVVDHHAAGRPFGDVRLVDAQAAATVVLVAELLERLGTTLDEPLARCLYTGLVTDTGSFRHASTTPPVHALAARLLATGLRPELVAQAIWDSNPFSYLPVLGAACARAQLEPAAAGGRGMVWTALPAGELAAAGLGLADVEGVIDVVRTAREAEVACVLKQGPDGHWRVSIRSRGAVDVGSACAALGGGGHRYAAGFTCVGTVEEALEALRGQLG